MKLCMSDSCRFALALCLSFGGMRCAVEPGGEEALPTERINQQLNSCRSPTTPAATPATPASPPTHERCAGEHDYPDVTNSINGPSIIGSTVGADKTFAAGCAFNTGGDVVYEITPRMNGVVSISTGHPGTNFDTVLAVLDACDDPPTEVACNDDCAALNDRSACVNFFAVAGQTYLIVVTGFASSSGDFEMSITQEEGRPGAIPASPATPSGHAIPGGPDGPAIPPTACEHHLCDRGGPLQACCSWCVEKICAIDSFCCEFAWDGFCTSAVSTACHRDACPPP